MKHLAATFALALLLGCGGGGADTGQSTETGQSAEAPQADADHCVHDGQLVTRGESRDAADGCNTCTCDGDDMWACTEMACPDDEEATP